MGWQNCWPQLGRFFIHVWDGCAASCRCLRVLFQLWQRVKDDLRPTTGIQMATRRMFGPDFETRWCWRLEPRVAGAVSPRHEERLTSRWFWIPGAPDVWFVWCEIRDMRSGTSSTSFFLVPIEPPFGARRYGALLHNAYGIWRVCR